ncbi:hypothetical protein MMPV_000820 [Pyropia vietnamensis]
MKVGLPPPVVSAAEAVVVAVAAVSAAAVALVGVARLEPPWARLISHGTGGRGVAVSAGARGWASLPAAAEVGVGVCRVWVALASAACPAASAGG